MIGKLKQKQGYKRKNKPNRTTVTKVCEECRKEYQSFKYESKKRRFCSRTCASRSISRDRMKERESRKCEYCGKDMKITTSSRNKRFCDWTCSNRATAEKRLLREVGVLNE